MGENVFGATGRGAARAKQRGLTLIGFVVVLAVVGFFAFMIMRLFPVYSEYYSVVSALNGLQAEPGIASKSPAEVRELLKRRFYISYVESVKDNNIRITRRDGYNVNVSYEVRRDFFWNLDFIATFDKTVELTRQGGE